MRADSHFLARDYQECVTVARQAIQLHPGCWLLYRTLGRAFTALGEYSQARPYSAAPCGPAYRLQIDSLAEIAYVEAAAGNRESAVGFLSRLEEHPDGITEFSSRRYIPLWEQLPSPGLC